ncbi:N-acetylmuramoyl-L-alanine amidase [Nitrococcus mobilis]|uniref:N-acetylmuramoyl-L-alanine amidase n=1 Tax=Nitrococcus mobilis Nb-231 TaxID=314278 RepID=A4BLP1_9GAMM|nr:N-acetylmuramoyl-L-alanine amidase [Nitrococcus mobilis]EAR23229.1 N-acetylmuramoyl-L-alanine amidase [Nitrococcus mobilis Nb-231]
MKRWLIFALLYCVCTGALGRQASVERIRTWADSDHTRVVFDLSQPVEYRLFTLSNPSRAVLDIQSAAFAEDLLEATEPVGVLGGIRSAIRNGSDLRVVFDLMQAARLKSFLVKPNKTYGNRLVVDFEKPQGLREPVKTLVQQRRELVVAIDAGHGGVDPGAIGQRGTFEKTITLAIAQKLAELISARSGMRAVLTRESDDYVGLRERTRLARQAHADLFISIHADSIGDSRARGASVYVLSPHGASTEAARLLAQRENSVDRIGGVSLDGKDDLVATVLVDLSRAATIESSTHLAQSMLAVLDDVGELHKSSVERAGFAVLKSLDMPSVLVESAFISNPREELRLRSSRFQWKLARALERGVSDYIEEFMPGRRIMVSAHEYVVRRGDTLSAIAQEYNVSVKQLRKLNDLNGDIIAIGSRLVIP